MKFQKILLSLILSLFLIGCAEPVPPEKSTYIGEWKSRTMYLLITQDGSVLYSRTKSGVKTSINNGAFLGFNGNTFEVGLGIIRTTFVVTEPPYQDGDKWKMVVDGMKLTKSPDE
jgi:hypothetical protein